MCICVYVCIYIYIYVYAVCLSLCVLLACLSGVLFVTLLYVWHASWPGMLFIPSYQVPHACLLACCAVLSPSTVCCLPACPMGRSFPHRMCFLPACQRHYFCLCFMCVVLDCPPSGFVPLLWRPACLLRMHLVGVSWDALRPHMHRGLAVPPQGLLTCPLITCF